MFPTVAIGSITLVVLLCRGGVEGLVRGAEGVTCHVFNASRGD